MASWDKLVVEVMGVPALPSTDAVLTGAREMAAAEGVAAPSVAVGRMLTLLAGERGARRVLEIGTGVGYWTVCLARGAGEPEVLSVDPDGERQQRARRLFAEAGLEERIALIEGEPLEVLQHLEAPFDLIHVVASEDSRIRLLDAALTRLEVGGLVVFNGVAPMPPVGEESAASPFCGYFLMYPQMDSVILPLGDGLAVGRKISPLITDQGGPY